MADIYVSRVELAVNGKSVTDFKSFSRKPVELNKTVKLMGKTGFVGVQPRYELEVEYIVPQSGAFDWSGVKDGTLTVTYDGGETTRYTGVTVLTLGEMKTDGENETTRTISLGAVSESEG
ncbi:MAG: hypothetical protein WC421_02790 [Elusimicrobiales bacterium]